MLVTCAVAWYRIVNAMQKRKILFMFLVGANGTVVLNERSDVVGTNDAIRVEVFKAIAIIAYCSQENQQITDAYGTIEI